MSSVATTQDQIYQGRLTFEQPKKGYRITTDTVLLAAAVRAKKRQHVLELGCGIGAALMMAAVRCPQVLFTGVEREEVYASLAEKNAVANGMEDCMSIIRGDISDKEVYKKIGTFDHVIANPPYFQTQQNNDVHQLRRVAREEDIGLEEWIKAANRFLKPKGSVTFIHAADRLDDLIRGFKNFCGDITVFPFFPGPGLAAKRIIVRGTKGSKAPLTLLPGLVLHGEGNKYYTERAERIIRYGQDLWQLSSE